jgi:transcriptional regulator with XRE-family HTH domain
LPYESQKKSKATATEGDLWGRIQQALGTSGVPETAKVMSLTKPSVYDWQKGKTPSLDTLIKIARLGGVSLHWLITGEGEKAVAPGEGGDAAYGILQKREREIVRGLASEEGQSAQEQIRELVVEALLARGLISDHEKAVKTALAAIEQVPRSRRNVLLLQLIRELTSEQP